MRIEAQFPNACLFFPPSIKDIHATQLANSETQCRKKRIRTHDGDGDDDDDRSGDSQSISFVLFLRNRLAALAALVVRVLGLAHLDDATLADGVLGGVVVVEDLAGDDVVDFFGWQGLARDVEMERMRRGWLPVRMFWNASSTLLASRAEVSIKDRLLSPSNY